MFTLFPSIFVLLFFAFVRGVVPFVIAGAKIAGPGQKCQISEAKIFRKSYKYVKIRAKNNGSDTTKTV
jgi:5-bromo-4-chloroindolyl phosphate hydrolysis protein